MEPAITISSCLQLEQQRKNEDPRLSFSTPEFKEAQRKFTDGFKVIEPLTDRDEEPCSLQQHQIYV